MAIRLKKKLYYLFLFKKRVGSDILMCASLEEDRYILKSRARKVRWQINYAFIYQSFLFVLQSNPLDKSRYNVNQFYS
jgi:hypothetical protein